MEFKDYYQILGVDPQADLKEIKKAYQTLAKKYHPDVNPGNKDAELKFKEINEAYHAIADPGKRAKYDKLRNEYLQWQKRGSRGTFDWSAWQESTGRTTYTRTMTPEEFADLFGDREFFGGRFGGFSDFFSMIFGREDFDFEPQDDFHSFRQSAVKGRDLQGEITITLEEAYHGAKKIIDIGHKRVEATIPKGIQDKQKIRLAGQGESGSRGGINGDLYLTVKILPHPVLTREGDDLSANLEIDFYTAVLGGEARINTLSGDVILKIPPKTQAGRSFRLKGKGMPVLNRPGQYGDFYAKTVIVLPPDLREEEIKKLSEIQKQRLKRKGE
ncbi:MAG TPA: J domain-containing protein [Peptococcaceae bacterium]|nr:J domain-containing protein [Peptococcaceae bacterium]